MKIMAFSCFKKIPAGVLKSFVQKSRSGKEGKLMMKNLIKFFKIGNTIKLEGQSGNGLFIDSFSTYHKGGFAKKRKNYVEVLLSKC